MGEFGTPQSAGAGGVLGCLVITACLLKLFQKLYLRQVAQRDAVREAARKAEGKAVERAFDAGVKCGSEKADIRDEGELEKGECPATYADYLRYTAQCETLGRQISRTSDQQDDRAPARPRTPAEILALQRPQSADSILSLGQLRGKVYSAHSSRAAAGSPMRGMASGPRCSSSDAFPERPVSRCSNVSTGSWRDDPNGLGPPTDEMQTGEWWAEAKDWWPEAVDANWESPYRPSSRESRRFLRQHRRPSSQQRRPASAEETIPDRPQSIWPEKLQQPMEGAYYWAKAAATGKKEEEVEAWPFADKPYLKPTPYISTSRIINKCGEPLRQTHQRSQRASSQSAWDTSNLPWETGARPYTPAPERARPSTTPAVPSQRSQTPGLGPGWAAQGPGLPPMASYPPSGGRPSTPSVAPPVMADEPHEPHFFVPDSDTATDQRSTTAPGSWRGFMDYMATGRPATAPAPQTESKTSSMLQELEATRNQTPAERKRIFRDLQRQLHPDKNTECEEEAKAAFQELMHHRQFYLKE